jgi:hypothetical protein|tara:strand:+ start:77 stop:784 length:708 start_codon:yes stop_codon:yes gene_type:complete
MVSLEHLAKKYGADKLDLGYINLYDEILSSVRNDFSKVLEIGVETGKSHRMWLEYFPNANIYGIDVFNEQDRSNYVEEFKVLQRGNPYLDRSVLFKGNQSNKEDLQRFISEHGNDFDMIIDDGGHSMEQMQMSLNYLWDSLKGGGLYIIEDLHTCSNQWESLYGYEIIKDGDTLTTDLLDSLSKKDDKITETNYISSEMLNKIRDELDWCETKIGVESYKNYTWPTMLNFMRKKI